MQSLALLPTPPVESVVDPTLHFWATVIWAAIAIAGMAYGVKDWIATKQPRAMMLFAAGGAMMLFEGMVDIMGGCWFPANSWIAMTLFGRPLPVWLCLAYFSYFGFGIAVAWKMFSRGVTRRQIWGAYIFAMVADAIQEIIQLNLGIYHYYGNQPLVLAKFPLWWAPVNGVIALFTAAICFLMSNHLQGRRQWLIIPIALAASAAANAATGWPSWLVINTPSPWWITQLGGVATFAFATWFVSLIARLVAIDIPAEQRFSGFARAVPA